MTQTRTPEDERQREDVVSCAILVATAFMLRDEDGLLRTLRQLVKAVEALENGEATAPADSGMLSSPAAQIVEWKRAR